MKQDKRDELRRRLEEMMLPFAANRERAGRVNGWLRAVRTSSGIPTRELAGRMGVQRGEITRLERLETEERIGMGKLRQAAEALGYELVYALVPWRGTLNEMAARQRAATKEARELKWLKKRMARPRRVGEPWGADALRMAARKVLRKLGLEVKSKVSRS